MEHYLPYVLVLVCPVSMGVMMWFMMRGQGDGGEKAGLERRVAEPENGARPEREAGGPGAATPTMEVRSEPEAHRAQA